MRVVILGSGVVGVTSAYYLARAGHEVTVIDRQAGPALETSFANAGQISPGYASPWAAPGMPLKAVKWMFQNHAPLAIRLDGTQFQLQWMWQMLQNCTPDALRRQQGPHGAPGRVQPRLPASAARRHRHRVRRPQGRHAAAVPHPAAARRRGQRHRRAARDATCRSSCWRRAELCAPSRRWPRPRTS